MEVLRAVELFAGVGGFRIGFEVLLARLQGHSRSCGGTNRNHQPTKDAAKVYADRWGLVAEPDRRTFFIHPEDASDRFVNEDIATVDAADIPPHDVLCGGFPCQDYSVAKTLDKASGLVGKKGVLWWEILRIARHHRPKYLVLENVDRLLKSPRGQRGRDFAVMLKSSMSLDMPSNGAWSTPRNMGSQRRKPLFIIAHSDETLVTQRLSTACPQWNGSSPRGASPAQAPYDRIGRLDLPSFDLRRSVSDDLADVSERFNAGSGKDPKSPFDHAGWMHAGRLDREDLAQEPDQLHPH